MKTKARISPSELIDRAVCVAAFVGSVEVSAAETGTAAWELPGVVDRWDRRRWERERVTLGMREHPDDATKCAVVAMLCERARAK